MHFGGNHFFIKAVNSSVQSEASSEEPSSEDDEVTGVASFSVLGGQDTQMYRQNQKSMCRLSNMWNSISSIFRTL